MPGRFLKLNRGPAHPQCSPGLEPPQYSPLLAWSWGRGEAGERLGPAQL